MLSPSAKRRVNIIGNQSDPNQEEKFDYTDSEFELTLERQSSQSPLKFNDFMDTLVGKKRLLAEAEQFDKGNSITLPQIEGTQLKGVPTENLKEYGNIASHSPILKEQELNKVSEANNDSHKMIHVNNPSVQVSKTHYFNNGKEHIIEDPLLVQSTQLSKVKQIQLDGNVFDNAQPKDLLKEKLQVSRKQSLVENDGSIEKNSNGLRDELCKFKEDLADINKVRFEQDDELRKLMMGLSEKDLELSQLKKKYSSLVENMQEDKDLAQKSEKELHIKIEMLSQRLEVQEKNYTEIIENLKKELEATKSLQAGLVNKSLLQKAEADLAKKDEEIKIRIESLENDFSAKEESLLKRVELMEDSIKSKNVENEDLSARLSKSDSEKEALSQELLECKNQEQILNKRIEEFQQNEEKFVNKERDLNNTIQELSDQEGRLNTKVEELIAKESEQNNTVTNLNERLRELSNKELEQNSTVEKLSQKLTEEISIEQNLKNEINLLKAELDNKKTLEVNLADLDAKFALLESEHKRLIEFISNLTLFNTSIGNHLMKLFHESESIEKCELWLKSLKIVGFKTENDEQHLKELQNFIENDLKISLKEKTQEITGLQAELRDKNSKINDLLDKISDIQESKEELITLRDQLTSEVSSLKSQICKSELSVKEDSFKNLTEQNLSLLQRINALTNELSEKTTQVKGLTLELQIEKEISSNMRNSLAHIETTLTKLRKTYDKVRGNISDRITSESLSNTHTHMDKQSYEKLELDRVDNLSLVQCENTIKNIVALLDIPYSKLATKLPLVNIMLRYEKTICFHFANRIHNLIFHQEIDSKAYTKIALENYWSHRNAKAIQHPLEKCLNDLYKSVAERLLV